MATEGGVFGRAGCGAIGQLDGLSQASGVNFQAPYMLQYTVHILNLWNSHVSDGLVHNVE